MLDCSRHKSLKCAQQCYFVCFLHVDRTGWFRQIRTKSVLDRKRGEKSTSLFYLILQFASCFKAPNRLYDSDLTSYCKIIKEKKKKRLAFFSLSNPKVIQQPIALKSPCCQIEGAEWYFLSLSYGHKNYDKWTWLT